MMAKRDKDEAAKWVTRITRAQKVKDQWKEMFRVPTGYEYWEGRQRPAWVPENEWITINMIFSNLMAELPTLYAADPYFYVHLKKSYSPNPMDIALYEQKAKIRQAMINYIKGEARLKQKARLAILDAYFQFGVVKIHYAADMQENPDKDTPITDDSGIPMMDGEEFMMNPEYIPTNEAYKLSRIHPDDFLVDEDAGPLDEDVKWKAQRIRRPLDEVRKDKKYNAAARKNIQATELSESQKEREQRKKGGLALSDKDEAEPDMAVVWEIYDIKNNRFFVVGEGLTEEFMIDPEPTPEGIEKDPFVDLRLVMRHDSWYPMPPVSQWLDSQREYCETRSKYLVHRKRFNRKYTIYDSAFDDPELAKSKLENGEDGTVIGQNQPMQTVYPIQDAPLDQNHAMEINYIRQDFMDLAVGPNQRGATAGVDSATEAGILEQRTQTREGDKKGLVIDFLCDIARKMDQCVQAHLTQDQAVKISGPQGDYWEFVKAADYGEIAGEYQYSIDVGQMTPQLPEIERAQWMAFLGLIAANPQLALSKRLMTKMAELHHIYDEAMIDEIFQIAKAMLSGKLPMPGEQGSVAGVSDMNPTAAAVGGASGIANFRGGQ